MTCNEFCRADCNCGVPDDELRIGDGVGLASDAEPEANGTVVDFVYVATAPPDERSQVRVYWRSSGGASDHRPGDLIRLT